MAALVLHALVLFMLNSFSHSLHFSFSQLFLWLMISSKRNLCFHELPGLQTQLQAHFLALQKFFGCMETLSIFVFICNNWLLKICADFGFCCFFQTWIWCTHILCQLFHHCYHEHHCVVSSPLPFSVLFYSCFNILYIYIYMEAFSAFVWVFSFLFSFVFSFYFCIFILLLRVSLDNLFMQIWCGARKRNEAHHLGIQFSLLFHWHHRMFPLSVLICMHAFFCCLFQLSTTIPPTIPARFVASNIKSYFFKLELITKALRFLELLTHCRDLNPLHNVIDQRNYKEKYFKRLIPLGLRYSEVT